MEQKAGRPDKTRKLPYEAPRVRRVRLDAAGSVLLCGKMPGPCAGSPHDS